MRSLKEIKELLEPMITEYMKQQDIPGMAVGIVKDGKLEYVKGFGVESIETQNPVSSTSMFHCASISKTFVATALMQLYEKGLLELDKPVSEYLPYFRLKDDRYKRMTIRQMMSHSAGMPDVYDYEWEKPQYSEDALENYIRTFKDLEALWEPGTKYQYSNLAYEALGDVIAKVSGMSFEDYMKKQILNPIGMNLSSFMITEVPKHMLTSPHVLSFKDSASVKVNEYYPYNRKHAPSSALCSNLEELSNYAITQLGKGRLQSHNLLKPSSYDIMWRSYIEKGRRDESMGLGWFLRNYKGTSLSYHSGFDTGYASNLILIPEYSAAIVLFCNCDYGNLHVVKDSVLDIVLGLEIEPLKVSAAYTAAKALLSNGFDSAQYRFTQMREAERDKYLFDASDFNSLGYTLLYDGKRDAAIGILKLGLIEFPNEANLYDSIGEMYREKGDLGNSIENYKKSIELDPHNQYGIKALKEMGVEV